MIKKFLPNNSCFNITTETYNGKEQSPKGLGYSAVGYNIGFEMIGKDNLIWSVQMKNNKKVWFRKNGMPIVTHEEPVITEIFEIPKEIEKEQLLPVQDTPKENKKTDYNIFYSYYTNKLKEEYLKNGIKKENKIIKDETIAEWNRLKKNKKELELLMNSIKNKT
jgi:hypothetical protein